MPYCTSVGTYNASSLPQTTTSIDQCNPQPTSPLPPTLFTISSTVYVSLSIILQMSSIVPNIYDMWTFNHIITIAIHLLVTMKPGVSTFFQREMSFQDLLSTHVPSFANHPFKNYPETSISKLAIKYAGRPTILHFGNIIFPENTPMNIIIEIVCAFTKLPLKSILRADFVFEIMHIITYEKYASQMSQRMLQFPLIKVECACQYFAQNIIINSVAKSEMFTKERTQYFEYVLTKFVCDFKRKNRQATVFDISNNQYSQFIIGQLVKNKFAVETNLLSSKPKKRSQYIKKKMQEITEWCIRYCSKYRAPLNALNISHDNVLPQQTQQSNILDSIVNSVTAMRISPTQEDTVLHDAQATNSNETSTNQIVIPKPQNLTSVPHQSQSNHTLSDEETATMETDSVMSISSVTPLDKEKEKIGTVYSSSFLINYILFNMKGSDDIISGFTQITSKTSIAEFVQQWIDQIQDPIVLVNFKNVPLSHILSHHQIIFVSTLVDQSKLISLRIEQPDVPELPSVLISIPPCLPLKCIVGESHYFANKIPKHKLFQMIDEFTSIEIVCEPNYVIDNENYVIAIEHNTELIVPNMQVTFCILQSFDDIPMLVSGIHGQTLEEILEPRQFGWAINRGEVFLVNDQLYDCHYTPKNKDQIVIIPDNYHSEPVNPNSSYFDCLGILQLVKLYIMLCFVSYSPIAWAANIHFAGKTIELNNAATFQDASILMAAKGYPPGNFIQNGIIMPLGETVNKTNGNIYFKLKERLVMHQSQAFSDIIIAGLNVHGIEYNLEDLNALIDRFDIDLLFVSGCQCHNMKIPNGLYFNKEKSAYGMAVLYNKLKYKSGDLNITSATDKYVRLVLESVDILYIYKPPRVNVLEWLNSIRHLITNKTLLFGDFNVNKNRNLTTNELVMFDALNAMGLTQFDFVEPISFKNHQGTSLVDHLFYIDECGYKVVEANLIDTTYISDHYMILVKLQLNTKNIVVHAKKSRWKVEKLKVEETSIYYKHSLAVNTIKLLPDIEQCLFKMTSSTTSPVEQLELSDMILRSIVGMYNRVSNEVIGKTAGKKQTHTSYHIDATTNRLLGHNDVANQIINHARQAGFDKFKDKVNEGSSTEFTKTIKSNLRRKGMAGQHLDFGKLEEYLDEWNPVWLCTEELNKPNIPHESMEKNWEECTVEEFNILIADLPCNKSIGNDSLCNEFFQNSPDNLIDFIRRYFNTIGYLGLIPTSFCYNIITPLHKGKTNVYNKLNKHHRPICLLSHLKKLFEGVLKPRIEHVLTSGNNQKGFKTETSTSDAVVELLEYLDTLDLVGEDYIIVSADVDGAFDTPNHRPLFNFINELDITSNKKSLLISLLLCQNICLQLGTNKTKYRSVNRGILQGSKISPTVFTTLIDKCISFIGTFNVWFVDDLLFVCKRSDLDTIFLQFEECLSQIGLKFNRSKTVIMDASPKRWIGFQTTANGCTAADQLENNLKKAGAQARRLGQVGVFSKNFKDSHLLRAIGTFILPCIDYGMNVFKPDKKLAKRVNVFLNTTVRQLLSIPFNNPNEDLHTLYNYNDYYLRWADLYSRFQNKLHCKRNNYKKIKYQPKTKMSFTVNKKLANLAVENPFLWRIYKRVYPKITKECETCGNRHLYVNQALKCKTKDLFIDPVECQDDQGWCISQIIGTR